MESKKKYKKNMSAARCLALYTLGKLDSLFRVAVHFLFSFRPLSITLFMLSPPCRWVMLDWSKKF